MTAQILYLRDYQNPKDLARMYGETTLEQQAVGLVGYLNDLTAPEMILYHGAGIDGMIPKDPA